VDSCVTRGLMGSGGLQVLGSTAGSLALRWHPWSGHGLEVAGDETHGGEHTDAEQQHTGPPVPDIGCEHGCEHGASVARTGPERRFNPAEKPLQRCSGVEQIGVKTLSDPLHQSLGHLLIRTFALNDEFQFGLEVKGLVAVHTAAEVMMNLFAYDIGEFAI
jgi:hypothetical protein